MTMDKESHNATHERFTRLFLASEPEILRYIMATVPRVEDAREVLQETATSLWKKLADYDGSMPFAPWACRFASLEIRAFLRREQRARSWLDEDVVALLLITPASRRATRLCWIASLNDSSPMAGA
jgi:RNA polymerase sigma-70 factor, ECF subfamily